MVLKFPWGWREQEKERQGEKGGSDEGQLVFWG